LMEATGQAANSRTAASGTGQIRNIGWRVYPKPKAFRIALSR
jgi:hypothetical protein